MWRTTADKISNVEMELDYLVETLSYRIKKSRQDKIKESLENLKRNRALYKEIASNEDFHKLRAGDFRIDLLDKGDMDYFYNERLRSVPNPTSDSDRKRRDIYETILNAGKHTGMCMYCLTNTAEQLDHFAPQEDFYWLSIEPLNLIPACDACNGRFHNKWSGNPNKSFIHPYFNIDKTFGRWLYASLEDVNPYFFKFYVKCDSSISIVDRSKIENQFKVLNLNFTYQKASSKILTRLRKDRLLIKLNDSQIREYLRELAEKSRYELEDENSFEAAIYEAVADSEYNAEDLIDSSLRSLC